MVIELVSLSEEETRRIARRLAARLRGGDVVALDGPLGAGKTCFVRGMAEGLGIDPRQVSSPTFILCQEYEPPESGGASFILAHLDGYRLASPDELETVGFDELLEAADTVIAVEWAGRFGDMLPELRISVDMAHADEHSRRLTVTAPDALADRISFLALPGASRRAECPVCGKPVARQAPGFPFCSRRCRLVDLGKWFDEGYRVHRPATEEDEI